MTHQLQKPVTKM